MAELHRQGVAFAADRRGHLTGARRRLAVTWDRRRSRRDASSRGRGGDGIVPTCPTSPASLFPGAHHDRRTGRAVSLETSITLSTTVVAALALTLWCVLSEPRLGRRFLSRAAGGRSHGDRVRSSVTVLSNRSPRRVDRAYSCPGELGVNTGALLGLRRSSFELGRGAEARFRFPRRVLISSRAQ